jgi:cytoplasmic iron level regulating protein YaaA (DUF328/UPF0246 family)
MILLPVLKNGGRTQIHNIFMKILLSPAKSLDFESPLPALTPSESRFFEQTKMVHHELKKLKAKDLQQLMHISADLAALNQERIAAFSMPFTEENSRPAVYAFDGDVYKGLDVYSLATNQIKSMQERLRILSGLYGMLRPLDLIQPYRLEMGTSLSIADSRSLYEFWTSTLTKSLENELGADELVVNLASKEYSKAVALNKLKQPVVHPEFKDFKDGNLKIISFYAKRMRGVMARYLIELKNPTLEAIHAFEAEGYRLDAAQTKDALKPIFTR